MAAKPARNFSAAQIERGLLAIAVANGNSRQAAKDLAEDREGGFEIDHSVLYRWKKREAVRYEKIRAELLPKIRAEAAEQHMRLAQQQATIAGKMAERLESQIEEIPARDLPGGLRNVVTSAAIHTDKAAALRGEASVIVERRDASEIIRALKARGILLHEELEQVEDAEVVEEEVA